ncbi:hypothetical protein OF83DRAFT_1043383, partial [Amylostereum chailletii]
SACRITQISYLVSLDNGGIAGAQQKMTRGHCAIIPQDVGQMSSLLPVAPADLDYAVCVLYVGAGVKPTTDNIKKLYPVLVSIRRVDLMSRFLTELNQHYIEYGITYSPSNLRELAASGDFTDGLGVPASVEISHLDSNERSAAAMSSGYDRRGHDRLQIPDNELLLENVGYASTNSTNIVHTAMRAQALQWCLDRKPFIQVNDGGGLLSDRDPRMMTFAFPHLDPWGIGGFNHPGRTGKYNINMERQLKNLMMMDDAPFASDPNFAYVCWNAIQRLEASRSTSFRIAENRYREVADVLMNSADVLTDMEKRWSKDPTIKPSTRQEKRIANAIEQIKVICRGVRGSNGSRKQMRNRIRSLLKSYGCPALF